MTSSSGEAITIAFIGRDNTVRIGSPTGGIATGNAAIPLSDGARLVLTVGYMADRNGKVYPGPIEPDQIIATDSAAADAGLDAAVEWLSDREECG